MKIDRNLYGSFEKKVAEHSTIKDLVTKQNYDEAENELKEKLLDKPEEFFTLEKISKSLGLDRKLTAREILLHVFGHLNYLPSKRECLEEEFDKLEKTLNPDESIYNQAKEVFEAYSIDNEFRDIVDSKKYAELNAHPSGEAFKSLPLELKEAIPSYVKDYVNLERLENVR